MELGDLHAVVGLGVAGNFAGHLEQAGEAGDFVGVEAAPEAPKGIFPWYVPGDAGFLGTFPLAHDRVLRPAGDVRLQIEPEVGLLADVAYAADGAVTALTPVAIAAFNDCSIRREGAPKISHKKNWGAASKGVARDAIPVTEIEPDGATSTFRLASFLRRGGAVDAYGIDSPLPGYSYYGTTLLDWIVERLAGQRGGEGTPLEDVGALLRAARPARVLVGIGATRYTEVGESTFLEGGDESIVVVYDGARVAPDEVATAVADGREDELDASVLRQLVAAA